MSGKPGLYRSYIAIAAVLAYRMVNFGAADNTVAPAVDGSKFIPGVTQIVGANEAGQQVDICRDGMPEVEYGAAVSKGDRLTADAEGRAVPADPGEWFLGYAEVDGSEGDIGIIFISPDKA